MKGWSCPTIRGNKLRLAAGLAGLLWASTGVFIVAAMDKDVSLSDDETIRVSPSRQMLPVGERLEFHGRWFGIPVGSGSLELKPPVDLNGRQAYLIEAHGRSNKFLSTFYPIRDVLRSWIDIETLQPLQFEKTQQEGHYRAEEIVTFDYTRHLATYRSLINQRSVKDIPIPDDVQDLLTTLYWIRRQPLAPGQPLTVPIYSDEKIYDTRITPMKTLHAELLRLGTFPCVMIEPAAAFKGVFVRRGRIWAYLTADERRLPLFINISTPWGPMTGVIDAASLRAASVDGQR